MPEHPQLSLRCPYCGGTLTIDQETAGPPYLTYETPESITCWTCDARWEPDGTFREPAKWLAFPDLYRAPDEDEAAGVTGAPAADRQQVMAELVAEGFVITFPERGCVS